MKTTPQAANVPRPRVIIFALMALACTAFGGPAAAGASEDLAAAIGRKDYQAVIRLIAPYAEAGDVRAQFMLGSLLESGQGTQVDFVAAAAWFRRAAEQGDVAAQARLGRMLAGFSSNEAFNTGLAKNDSQALFWLRKAAEGGEPSAMSALSVMYLNGRSVPRNLVLARMWNILAQQLGDYQARLWDQNFADVTSARETEEAARRAAEWLKQRKISIHDPAPQQ